MHSATLWTEGGGQGKTALAAGIAKSYADHGYNVLLVDMDSQKGSVTGHFGLINERETENGDSITEFLAGIEDTDIHDLIRTREGVDIIPNHNQLRDLETWIGRHGEPFAKDSPDEQLRRVIEDYELYNEYDVLLVDSPGSVTTKSKNAIYATRNVVVPIELSEKGAFSLEGIVENLFTYKRAKREDISIVGLVPNRVNDQLNVVSETRKTLKQRLSNYEEQTGWTIPVSPIEIADRESLFKGAFREGVSPQTFHREVKDRQYERDAETLEDIDDLAWYVMWHLSGGEEGQVPDPNYDLPEDEDLRARGDA